MTNILIALANYDHELQAMNYHPSTMNRKLKWTI